MGQKVNPNGFRYGINRQWQSRWMADSKQETAAWIIVDDKVRKYLFNTFRKAFIDRVEIERTKTTYNLFIYALETTLITGPENAKINDLIKSLNKIVGRKVKVNVNAITIQHPELSATIIAREIADAIENRISFRTAQKNAIRKVMKFGAKGIRTNVSGRLGGVEMAREEGYSEGQTPLTTLRADVDYAIAEANTTYGQIGCKVWINRGEIFAKSKKTIATANPTTPVAPISANINIEKN